MFFSLIPLLMLLLSLINYIGASQSEVIKLADEFTPNAVNDFLNTYMDEIIFEGGISMTIVSSIVLLWSASKGVFAIISGLNSVFEIKETRNYFILRLHAMLHTIAFIFLLMFTVIILVFGDKFNDLITSFFPNIEGIVYILSSLRFVILFIGLTLFFALMYKMLPSGKIKFYDQIPGAVISSGGWVIFSTVFSFFVDNFGNYANIYGSLTAIIILMLWLYFCMYIMFLGAEINLILSKNSDEN